MRILFLTAGTGSFFCGTCMRDNALTAALCRQGHDAILLPLYLPTMLDEEAATPHAPLFYGGINVYLQQVSRLFRKTPRWLDRLLDSPGLLKAAARRAGMTRPDQLGDLTLSVLRGEEGRQAKELDRLVEWLTSVWRPEVVCLSQALLIGLARRIKQESGAAMVCTLQGEDTFLDSLPEPYRRRSWETIAERAADVDAFVAVSRYHAGVMMRRARLPEERVQVVYNGIALEGYPIEPKPPPAATDAPTLGYLARLCPAKGLHTLVEAYILLRRDDRFQNLKLRVAGSMTAAEGKYVAGLRQRLAEEGLSGDVEFLPNVSREEKIAFLRSLTIFSVPATYGESFGLYLIEALAAGVPVVQPDHAAFPELIETTGGGLLCEPDSPRALAEAVAQLLADPVRARTMGEAGRQAVREKFCVERMAANVMTVFEEAFRKSGDALRV